MLAMVLHLLAHLHQLRMQQLQQTRRGGGASSESNSPIIQFKDPNLKAALLEHMKLYSFFDPNATEITEAQAEKVQRLGMFSLESQGDGPLRGKGIKDITDLQYFKNLQTLDLSSNDITDISPLEKLPNLQWLTLNSDKNITDFSPLAKLTKLSRLSCNNTNISDLSPLKDLKELMYLCLENNQISNISPLKDFSNLLYVGLSHNQITDISPLKDLSKLEGVDLSYNQITDFSSINSNIAGDGELKLDGNPIKSLDPIKNMKDLQEFSLQDMEITRKVSASSIQLSSLLGFAKYCTFTVEPTDAGTVENGVFTLKNLPPNKKVTINFTADNTSAAELLPNDDVTIECKGTIVLDYSSEEEPQVGSLYRLYNPYTHEHFFTAETTENDNLVRLGWKSEGSAGYVYKHGEKGGVYRLYNPTTGEHHYTMNEDEVAQCVKAGWKNEGVKWFSAQNKEVTLNKLYSMYNPYEKKFYHHYTADADEIARMVKAGWRKEEVKWCTLPVSAVK